MIADIHSIGESQIDADICIIGTGAAGILLALELKDTGKKIVMLEGGNMSENPKAQALFDLESASLPVANDSRRRVFGGTTTAWTGGWKPLDESDFEGWPLQKSDLIPHYDRAAAYVGGLTVEDFTKEVSRQRENASVSAIFTSGQIARTFLWTLPRENWNFGKKFRQKLADSSSIHVLYNANVTQLRVTEHVVSELVVKTLNGASYSVKARTIIVACGGIENARLLLHSKIGNAHDQVGRYYMDHPKGNAGTIVSKNFASLKPLFKDRKKNNGGILVSGLQLSPASRATHRTTNSYVQLRAVHRDRGIVHRVFAKLFGLKREVTEVRLRTFMEQVPSPENRVVLSGKRDAFGNPLAKVHWSISEQDKQGVRVLHKTLQEELSKSGLGTLAEDLAEPWPVSDDASHHMGTTRMGTDPKTSVVDENCRVHGMKNLYVAGSSVFPTGGHANPTATIMALAVRLADHVKSSI